MRSLSIFFIKMLDIFSTLNCFSSQLQFSALSFIRDFFRSIRKRHWCEYVCIYAWIVLNFQWRIFLFFFRNLVCFFLETRQINYVLLFASYLAFFVYELLSLRSWYRWVLVNGIYVIGRKNEKKAKTDIIIRNCSAWEQLSERGNEICSQWKPE